jgi:hypothetical protein
MYDVSVKIYMNLVLETFPRKVLEIRRQLGLGWRKVCSIYGFLDAIFEKVKEPQLSKKMTVIFFYKSNTYEYLTKYYFLNLKPTILPSAC